MNFRDQYFIIGEIGIEKKQFGRYCHYAMKVEKMMKNDEQVPTAWIKKIVSYFRSVGLEEESYYNQLNKEKIELSTKEALEHFGKEKDEYVFSGKYIRTAFSDFDWASILSNDRVKPPPPDNDSASKPHRKRRRGNIEYSFETLLRSCIGAYLSLQEPKKTKEQAVRFFLAEIKKYTDNYFSDVNKKKMTPYKAQVIAGYLTMKVANYRLSSKVHANCTNPNIYEATRNALRPKKKKD